MKQVQKGFTLIELMIVVAIIGILAAIAIPQYQNYITRSKWQDNIISVESLKLGIAECVQNSAGVFNSCDDFTTAAGLAGSELSNFGITTMPTPKFGTVTLINPSATSLTIHIVGTTTSGSVGGCTVDLVGTASQQLLLWDFQNSNSGGATNCTKSRTGVGT